MDTGETDEALLAAVGRREQHALRLLYERHAKGVMRLLARLTSDRTVAEEVLQDTFLAVWRHYDGYRGQASVRSWLYGVARRRAHDTLRGRSIQLTEIDERYDVVEREAGPEERALASAEVDDVARAMRELPGHLRVVIELVAGEGMGYTEVSAVLGIPVGTVKSRMSHARQQLAAALDGTRT